MSPSPSSPSSADVLTLLLAELRDNGVTLVLTPTGLTLRGPKRVPPYVTLLLGQLKERRSELYARLWAELEPSHCDACGATVFIPDPESAGFCERVECPYLGGRK